MLVTAITKNMQKTYSIFRPYTAHGSLLKVRFRLLIAVLLHEKKSSKETGYL